MENNIISALMEQKEINGSQVLLTADNQLEVILAEYRIVYCLNKGQLEVYTLEGEAKKDEKTMNAINDSILKSIVNAEDKSRKDALSRAERSRDWKDSI